MQRELNIQEFFDLIKVLKMLYGRDIAEKVFDKHLDQIYTPDNESSNLIKLEKIT